MSTIPTPSSITPPSPESGAPASAPAPGVPPTRRATRPLSQPVVNQRTLQRSEDARGKRVSDLMEEKPGAGKDDSVVSNPTGTGSNVESPDQLWTLTRQ